MSRERERVRGPWPGPGAAPSQVEITILADPAARPLRKRIGRASIVARRRAVAALVLVLAVIGLEVVGVLGGAGAARRPAGVAAAYKCPVRSLPRAVQVQLGVCQ